MVSLDNHARVEETALDALRPHPRNPNRGNVEQIRKSLRKNGWFGAVVAQRSTGFVLVGNHRVQAARLEGLATVPVHWLDCDDEAALRVMLADNKTAEDASRDPEALAALLDELLQTSDLDGTGYDASDLDALLESLTPPMTSGDEEESPDKAAQAEELRLKWGVAPGQVWVAGTARVACGSCLDEALLGRLLRGQVPDLLLTDPPYGVSAVRVKGRGAGKVGAGGELGFQRGGTNGAAKVVKASLYAPIEGDEDTQVSRLAVEVMERVGVPHKIIWGGNYFTDFLPPSQGWIVWDKENTGNTFADVELAWTSFDRAARLYRWLWNGLARKGDRGVELKARMHPTQKPVGLHEEILSAWAEAGWSVIDPFAGSGTTVLAAVRQARTVWGVELSPAYVALLLERLSLMGLDVHLEVDP